MAGLEAYKNFYVWTCCIGRIVWLSLIHIPGKGNTTTDYKWRLLNENPEWKLFSMIKKNPAAHFTLKTHY